MAFFADNSNNDEEDEFDNNEEDSIDNVEGEGYDDEDEEVSLTSEISVDQAREQLEDMMSIPKDNYDLKKRSEILRPKMGHLIAICRLKMQKGTTIFLPRVIAPSAMRCYQTTIHLRP